MPSCSKAFPWTAISFKQSYLFLSLFIFAVDEQWDLSSTALRFLPSTTGAPLHLSTVTRTNLEKHKVNILQWGAPYCCHSTKFLINFWHLFDNVLMSFVSTAQSKCKNYEVEMSCSTFAFWQLTSPPPTVLAIWFASLNGSHQKVFKKLSKINQKHCRVTTVGLPLLPRGRAFSLVTRLLSILNTPRIRSFDLSRNRSFQERLRDKPAYSVESGKHPNKYFSGQNPVPIINWARSFHQRSC